MRNKWKSFYLIFLLIFLSAMIFSLNTLGSEGLLEMDLPELVLKDVPFTVSVKVLNENGQTDHNFNGRVEFSGIFLKDQDGPSGVFLDLKEGQGSLGGVVIDSTGRKEVTARIGETKASATVRAIPGFLSILPPLLAILLALLYREVVIALVAGTWLGAVFIYDYNILGGFYKVMDYFVINAITDSSKAQIIVFSMMFGGMVGVITQNGGARGVADLITRFAKTPRRGQLACVGSAFFLFFDDYANILVRGKTGVFY